MDALKLSPCYPAFLITAEVPEVYMHQFWNTIQKIKDTDAYQFKLDKKKFRVDTEAFREILQICPRLLNQDFVKPPSEEELVTFIKELGASLGRQHDLIDSGNHELKSCGYGALIPNDMINQDIKDSKAYKTYLDFATRKTTLKKARKFKKVASPSRKLSHVLEEEPVVKPKRAKKPAKKSTTVPTVALHEVAQLKKTLKKSKLETQKLHASGSDDGVGSQPKVPDEQEDKTTSTDEGTGTKLGVPDVPKYLSKSENESWGDSDDDDNDDDSDEVPKDDDEDDVESDADDDKESSNSEKTDSDEDENPNLNQNDDEEEEHEEEYVRTPDSVEFTDNDEEYEEIV
ncbi:hypothetical protein Tco_1211888 [Tanacetum coccineum]